MRWMRTQACLARRHGTRIYRRMPDSAAYLEGLIVNFVNNGAIRQKMQDYDQPEDTAV